MIMIIMISGTTFNRLTVLHPPEVLQKKIRKINEEPVYWTIRRKKKRKKSVN